MNGLYTIEEVEILIREALFDAQELTFRYPDGMTAGVEEAEFEAWLKPRRAAKLLKDKVVEE